MLERLEGLDEEEQTACLIAERALGATATAYDVPADRARLTPFLTTQMAVEARSR